MTERHFYSPIAANVFDSAAEQRFRSRIAPPDANGCCLWTGSIRDGYGVFYLIDRHVRAHRLAWELAYGPIPGDLNALHKCDTRACVNPEHLFLGTNAENIADKVAKGRQAFQRGSKHGMARITEADAIAIFLAEGTNRMIAARFGISNQQVSKIKRQISWAHTTASLSRPAETKA